jgi:MSHA biogenesis protein MshJ
MTRMLKLPGYTQLRDRVSALSAREQSLVILVVAVGFYFFIDALLISPQSMKLRDLMAEQESTQVQLLAARAELDSVKPASEGVLARQAMEYNQLKAQVQLIEAVTAQVSTEVPRLNSLVVDVLKTTHPRVSLTNLKTLPVKALFAPLNKARSENATARAAAIYRHGVEIEVRGNYLDLLAYVHSLESVASGSLWSEVNLNTLKYPESALRITLYVLSNQPRLNLS